MNSRPRERLGSSQRPKLHSGSLNSRIIQVEWGIGQQTPAASSVRGSYSRQELLKLYSDGRFSRGGETYSSGEGGTALGESGNSGQWSAEGDGNQATLILNHQNGRTDQIHYQKVGVDIILDGRKYARYGDGSCTQKSPF